MRSAFALAALLAVPARSEDGQARLLRETREHTKALIALDTSNPPGDEILAARYLKGVLDEEGIESRIYTSTGTRASLIARLRGSGKKRPLLLMCHTDVVPADPKGWSTPPFTPVEKDGYLQGRGAADIKSMCAAEAAVLLRLKREKVPLDRDVVFFAEADEETGASVRHIDWLIENHGSELDAEFAINEGGLSIWEDGKVSQVLIEAAEKQYLDVHLVARGTAGHSSVPRKDNAVAALAQAVRRLSTLRMPAELDPVARAFFAEKAPRSPEPLRSAVRAVLRAKPGRDLDRAADRLAELAPDLGAMLRDTLVPTVLAAGYKSNVIPAEARATLNARLLPSRRVRDFGARLEAALEGLPVSVVLEAQAETVGAMPVDNELMRAAREAAAGLFPDAFVSPYMAAWSTDSQDLRARGTLVYGIDPAVTEKDLERVHGDDERVPLGALDAYARYLWEITTRVASSPEVLVASASELRDALAARTPPPLPRGFLPVPVLRQATEYSCGAAALLSALYYWRVSDDNESSLYRRLGTTEKDGTSPERIVETARAFGLEAELREGLGVDDLRAALAAGKTVILDLQAWITDKNKGKPLREVWDEGHYVVLVGMDEKNAYVMDPAAGAGYAWLPIPELLERWHDYEDRDGPVRRYRNMGIAIRGKTPLPSAPAPLIRME